METGLGERARCQQQVVEGRALLAPGDLPAGAPRQAQAPCPLPLTAGGCLGPALRLLLSWAALIHFHYEQELLETSNHPMWFHLLVGTEGSCVFIDSKGDPAQSSQGTHLGAQPLSWGSYKRGRRRGCWRPGQSGEVVGPLRPWWVRLRPATAHLQWGGSGSPLALLGPAGAVPPQSPDPPSVLAQERRC